MDCEQWKAVSKRMIETICEIKIKGQTLSFSGRAHESLFKSSVLLDLRIKTEKWATYSLAVAQPQPKYL